MDERGRSWATRNVGHQALRRKPEEPAIRPFSRDADRIIHSKAYARYIDKTQVFYLVENAPHHRVLHVNSIKIRRTISRALGLNRRPDQGDRSVDIGPHHAATSGRVLDELCREYGIRGSITTSGRQFHGGIEDCDLTLRVLDVLYNGDPDRCLAPEVRPIRTRCGKIPPNRAGARLLLPPKGASSGAPTASYWAAILQTPLRLR